MIAWPAKDPADVADFTWTPALDAGDTIATFVVTITAGTITKQGGETATTTQGTVWFTGGADKELARGGLLVTTAGGRTFRDGFVLPVFDRATEALGMFRLRYPAFAAVSDGDVSFRLYEALSVVGDNWQTADQEPARAAWAAHQLTAMGVGASMQGVTSFKSGTFSASLSDAAASRTGYAATQYGRDYLDLMRRNFAGPISAWTVPTSV